MKGSIHWGAIHKWGGSVNWGGVHKLGRVQKLGGWPRPDVGTPTLFIPDPLPILGSPPKKGLPPLLHLQNFVSPRYFRNPPPSPHFGDPPTCTLQTLVGVSPLLPASQLSSNQRCPTSVSPTCVGRCGTTGGRGGCQCGARCGAGSALMGQRTPTYGAGIPSMGQGPHLWGRAPPTGDDGAAGRAHPARVSCFAGKSGAAVQPYGGGGDTSK